MSKSSKSKAAVSRDAGKDLEAAKAEFFGASSGAPDSMPGPDPKAEAKIGDPDKAPTSRDAGDAPETMPGPTPKEEAKIGDPEVSKAVTSRDGGGATPDPMPGPTPKEEAKLGQAEARTPPDVNQTITEPVSDAPAKKKKKAATKEQAELAPKVVPERKGRLDRPYHIHGTAPGEPQSVSDVGDVDAIPKVETWRIIDDRTIMLDGRQVLVRAGQVVTSLTHKLDLLRAQGVVLESVQ